LSHTKIIDFCACLWPRSLKKSQVNTFVRAHHTPPGPKNNASRGERSSPNAPTAPQSKSVSYRCCDGH
jgi:hypothetical protein